MRKSSFSGQILPYLFPFPVVPQYCFLKQHDYVDYCCKKIVQLTKISECILSICMSQTFVGKISTALQNTVFQQTVQFSANLYQTCTTLSRMPVPCITVKVFSMLQNSSLVPVIQHVYCSKFLLADKKIPFYIVFISEDAKETIWTRMCLHTNLPTHVI